MVVAIITTNRNDLFIFYVLSFLNYYLAALAACADYDLCAVSASHSFTTNHYSSFPTFYFTDDGFAIVPRQNHFHITEGYTKGYLKH
jgi:hypothetical protein